MNPLEPLLFLAVSTEYLVHRAASGKYMREIQHSEFGERKQELQLSLAGALQKQQH